MKGPELNSIGRYEILSKVGEGANGIVYRAQDPTIRRIVALKVIPAEPVEQSVGQESAGRSSASFFEREAQAAGALLHPNIVTLYDAGLDGGWYYLAMEFIEGGTFAGEISTDGGVTLERAVEVTAVVADALDFAHERGVVHRDIKPANLMTLPDQTVKVADFGIARLTSATQTMTSDMMVGTPHYMSPEQVRGGKVDGRSDLFSLAVVLYESLTRQRPFQAESLAAILNRILTGNVTPPHEINPAIPLELSLIVMKALSTDPANRFKRGREFATELRRYLRKHRGEAPPVAAPKRSSGAKVAALAAVLAAVLGAGGYFMISEQSQPAVRKGFIRVTADDPGAEVFLDGKLIGPLPVTFEAPEGDHELEFQKEGHYPGQISVTVVADQQIEIAAPPLLSRTGR